MTCDKVRLVALRHNKLRDTTVALRCEVCQDVAREPILPPAADTNLLQSL